MQGLSKQNSTKELLLGNATIQAKLDRYKDIPMRQQLDAARKHLALEIRIKFP